MSYVHGVDLATVLRRAGTLPVARVLRIARSVASGLLAAHTAGVVHRDLKPANIMVDDDDEALIMDFGIARSSGGSIAGLRTGSGALPENLRRAAVGVTAGEGVVGTVQYMAPEQAQGQAVDQRADIYAFGLILYDLLVGGHRVSEQYAVFDRDGGAAVRVRVKKARCH
jgi:serine/threonine protein kinase